jgi:hypothetical protein
MNGEKRHGIVGSVQIHIDVSAELNFTSYPQALLKSCKALIDDKQYGISVVVAHMACEVATERLLLEKTILPKRLNRFEIAFAYTQQAHHRFQ